MSLNQMKLATTLVLLLGSSVSIALPFGSYDPRSMAMGGAGVAVADAGTAPLFNPALLSVTRYSDDFSMILPTVSIRVADPDDLVNSFDSFQSGNYVEQLTTAVDSLNTAINAAPFVLGDVNTNAATVATKLSNLSTQLDILNNKPIALEGGLATVIGIPNKKFGAAFYANRTATTGGSFQYKDASVLATLSTQASCLAAAADAAAVAACGTPSFTSSTLQSSVTMRGVMLTEIGMAFSREFYINKQRVSLGITPKSVQAQLYEIPVNVNSNNLSMDTNGDYLATYSMLNFDLGIAQNYRNGWRSGLVIKNVIPYILYFKNAPTPGATPVYTGSYLRLMPQSRIGVSHTNRWSVIALDADLYRNDPVGLENYTQYISLGGELNAWRFAQLRAGYRADLVNSARNTWSLGLGLSPFGVHTDIAYTWNEHEMGASFQLGFNF